MTDIGPLQVRRGTNSSLSGFTPANGEPVLNTQTHELLLGDSQTEGGNNAAGPRNIRRLRSTPYGLQRRYPTVTKLWDLGWWSDPDDGNGGTGFSTKQGYSLTSQPTTDPWEAFGIGLVPAGSFASGSWIDVHVSAYVHAQDGSTNIAPRFGLVWDFDGTQISQAAHGGGEWHAAAYHDIPAEDEWVQGQIYDLHFRIQAMGRSAHFITVEQARLYNTVEPSVPASGAQTTWDSSYIGRMYYNELDMSVDHTLYPVASLNGPITHPANDLRIRSTCAYMYGWTGGVRTDLFGTSS